MAVILPYPQDGDDDTSFILAHRQNAVLRAMDASEQDPDDAARANTLSQTTGTSPSLIQQDQDEFDKQTKARLTAAVIRNNPHLQDYVNGHPLAASISNDDWTNLHDLSQGMNSLGPGKWGAAASVLGNEINEWAPKIRSAFEGLGAIHSAGVQEATEQAEEARKAAVQDSLITPQQRKEWPQFTAALDALTSPYNPLGWVVRKEYEMFGGPSGLLGMTMGMGTGYIHGATAQALRQFGVSGATADSVARDLAAITEAESAGLTGRAHVGEPAGSIVQRLRTDMVVREGQAALSLAKPFLDAGEVPPAGLHPYIDSARAIMSKIDGDQLERVTKQAQSTNTWGRDKEFQLEHFLSLWPDSHIEVPAEAVAKLYGTKLPEPDDGILGWVPNLASQMESAALTGEKIEIPRSLWITHADPEIRKALKDDAAWRPGSISNKEADEVLKTIPDQMAERQPLSLVRVGGEVPGEHEFAIQQQGTQIGVIHIDERDGGKGLYVDGISVEGGPNALGPSAVRSLIAELSRQFPNAEMLYGVRWSGARELAGKEKRGASIALRGHEAQANSVVDSLYRIAHLENPDQMVERLSPVEARGLDFRNIIPEGSARPIDIRTINQSGDPVTLKGTHHFPLRSLLPNLYRGQLEGPARVLSDFFGKQLERLAGDVPVSVVSKEVMQRDYGGETTLGFYDPTNHRIVLRSDIVDGSHPSYYSTMVVMHEAAHAISSNALRKFKPLADYTKKLMNHTFETLRKVDDTLVSKHAQAFKNEREFIAEAIGNSDFQTLLNGIPLTDELARGLRLQQGSMWDAVRQVVKEMWTNLVGKVPDNSVMDAIFRLNQALEDINAKLEQVRTERVTPEQMVEAPEDPELFAAKALGMSKRVYTAMRDLALKRRDEKAKLLSEQAAKEEAERQTSEWKQNEAVMRELVQDHVMHLPDIAADHFLRTGELFGTKYRRARLDGRLIDTTGLDDEHWNPTQGLRPDAIAEALGFQSGDQMVQALRNLKSVRDAEGLTPQAYITRMVDALTDREMKERYGKLEENILNAAKEHIFGETQYDILHEHTLRYAEQLGLEKPGFTKDDIRAMARIEMAKVRVGRIDSTRAMKLVGDTGRMVEAAEATGDWDTAFKLSQRREIDFQLAKMQMAAEKKVEKFKSYAKRGSKRDGFVESLGLGFSNAIQDILQRVGVGVRRTPEDIAREWADSRDWQNLRGFVESHALPEIIEQDRDFPAATFNPVTVSDFLLDPTYRAEKGWREMTWEEFEAVHNSIDSLYANGRKAQKILIGGAEADHQQLITDMVSIFHEVFGSPEDVDVPIDPKKNWKVLWAGLIQMESLWSRLARDDPKNPFMKMNMDIMGSGTHLRGLERQFSKEWLQVGEFPKDMMKTVENHLFFEPNERGGPVADIPMTVTVRNLLAMLQNVGNWSNYDKFSRGYGLENAQVREMWRKTGYQMWMNDPVMSYIFKHTTKEDWDRAQALGDMFERMFSMSETVYYGMGARPGPRLELRPIETPFGTYKGWYHPIIYDSQRPMFWTYDPETGERKAVSRAAIANPMEEAGVYHVATPSGYQKARTGYAAPLLLNFDAVPGRIKSILNDMAMRPVITEVNKIFSDPRFTTAMSKTYGPHYSALLKPYLRDIAGQRRYVDPLQVVGGKIASYFYQNLVSTAIGLNPGTVAKHFLTATQNSVNKVGAVAFWAEFANTWLNPLGWKNAPYVINKSNEVASRMRNSRESLTGAYEELFPGGAPAPLTGALGEKLGAKFEKARQLNIKAGATPVAISDLASVIPMWNVEFKRQRRAGVREGDAIDAADKLVREAHGSTVITARPQVMRSGWGNAISPFYNFFNNMLQRQYETAWRAKDAVGYLKDGNYQKGVGEMGKVAAGIWTYVFWPAIVEQIVSPIIWDEDDDNYLKQGAEIIARDVASSFPLIRDIVALMFSGHDPSFSIYGSGAQDINQFLRDVEKGDYFDEDKAGKRIKHFATMVGATLGLANAQIGRWGQFAYEYATGRQDPESPLTMEGLPQWYRALRFGDIKERKK